MSGSLLGLYHPADTWVHRTPTGLKLLAVALAGTSTLLVRGPWAALALLGVALALVLGARLPLTVLARALRGLLVLTALLGLWLWWQRGWPRAVESVSELVALVLVATVLTATTPLDVLLATVSRGLGPLRRVGVDPELVALAFTLVVRAVPATLELAQETRQAAIARGRQRDPRALLVPLVLRVVARARATGEALHARGIGD